MRNSDNHRIAKPALQQRAIIIGMNETPEAAREYVASAVAAGINYFDIAPSYGNV